MKTKNKTTAKILKYTTPRQYLVVYRKIHHLQITKIKIIVKNKQNEKSLPPPNKKKKLVLKWVLMHYFDTGMQKQGLQRSQGSQSPLPIDRRESWLQRGSSYTIESGGGKTRQKEPRVDSDWKKTLEICFEIRIRFDGSFLFFFFVKR